MSLASEVMPGLEVATDELERAKNAQLELLRARLAQQTYPGYPKFRLQLPSKALPVDFWGRPIFPRGTWEVDSHPNRPFEQVNPSEQEQVHFRGLGLELDADGRPLHPWYREMMDDPAIGVVTGKGFYYQWGPNYTADPIIIANGHILLIKRRDTGSWALPGGHINVAEDPLLAAKREATEETGIVIPDDATGELIYQGPVADIRSTVNAWPETSAYLFMCDGAEAYEPAGADDAAEAAWVPIWAVLEEEKLFGSHKYLFNKGLARLLNVVFTKSP